MPSAEQCERAARCARGLGAPIRDGMPPQGLYRALLALVESVERPYTKEELEKKPPVSDARKVLRAPKKPKKVAEPVQEGLW